MTLAVCTRQTAPPWEEEEAVEGKHPTTRIQSLQANYTPTLRQQSVLSLPLGQEQTMPFRNTNSTLWPASVEAGACAMLCEYPTVLCAGENAPNSSGERMPGAALFAKCQR
eukprot:CAMPEP_0174358058 /NCGR_PEP_ID=MMETSP0811_2-20130205/39661_1 /TAXON_ID=73025 ORGANISM="Eutreptiella gymnastica-like, Strain CCMP1594" /NCGR_SAMPLE_ID=MMETSP0811_2 /ASSEMBLY_ACC=CAM_ASM_000667 /LENGTH=110 /DNA_ID=CAMNT_0015491443 /DNA_START=63 /DNA_END=392 /DNA_ORIENTATION=-